MLLEKNGKHVINRKFVGRDATYILQESGVSYQGNPRLVIAEVDKYHPFVMVEMLMPVLGIVRVKDMGFDYAGGFNHMLLELSDALPHTAFTHQRLD